MATILIVDDRPSNRDHLLKLLARGNHRLREASDGPEALEIVRSERPELVIANVFLPTMDGSEFVRRLRADPTVATTPILFGAARYHERDAHVLAKSCRKAGVLAEPCEAQVVLDAVEVALGRNLAHEPIAEPKAFDAMLSEKAFALQRANERLSALIELDLQLRSERDPPALLRASVKSARELVGARYAIVGILDGAGNALRYCFASGLDAVAAERLVTLDPHAGVLGRTFRNGRAARGSNADGDPTAANFPAQFPAIHTWLAVPVRSLTQTYGWLALVDKIGGGPFGDDDERLADILAAQLGRSYESATLHSEVLRQSEQLHRKASELSRAERQFRTIVESAPDAVVVVDGRGQIAMANERTEKHFGYSRAELIGRPIEVLFAERFRQQSIAARLPELADPEANPPSEALEIYGLRKDGREFPVEINLNPLQTEDGTLSIVVLRNVSARKQGEAALRASEELLRSAFDRSNVAMALTDASDRFFRVNAAFSQTFGYAQAELLHLAMRDIVHPDDLPEFEDRRKDLRDGVEQFYRIECRFLHKDGRTIWGLTNASLVRDSAGQPQFFVGQIQDVTERKRTEASLLVTQKRLERVVSSNPAVIYTSEVEDNRIRKISWISDNLREVMGYSPEEALDPNWWFGNIHPEDRKRVREHIHRALPANGRAVDEYRFRDRGGDYRWVRNEMKLLRDPDGKPVEVIGSWSDIAERKLLEDQIHQSQKMEAIGKLAGGIAHDFNNLLTVINGYCELLIDGLHPSNPLCEPLQEIHRAGERAASLTRQLLAFSRKAVLSPEVLDLNALVRNLQKMLARLIGEDVELRASLEPNLWKVKVDPGQMEQVIVNLVVNARDAMPRGGKLTIETANVELDESYAYLHPDVQPGPYVRASVSDTGSGMDLDTQARVFEPFFTTKGPDKGTGLGLSVVHGIVKQSGGRVEVYSEIGLGATFKIYLPRAGDKATVSLPQSSKQVRGGTETILLVEDEAGVRSLSRTILEKLGYTVLDASSGEEAIARSRNYLGSIEIMVTDTVMPKMSGTQLAQQLAAMRPKMKVLYLSGYTDDAVIHHGLIDPRTPFLQKPFTLESLASKVRELLDS